MTTAVRPTSRQTCPDCHHPLTAVPGGYQCQGHSCAWVAGTAYDLLAAVSGGYEKLPSLDADTVKALKSRRRIFEIVIKARWRQDRPGPMVVCESALTKKLGMPHSSWRQFYVILSRSELEEMTPLFEELNPEFSCSIPAESEWFAVMPYYMSPYQVAALAVLHRGVATMWEAAPERAAFAGIVSLDPADTRETFLAPDQETLTAMIVEDPDVRVLAWRPGTAPCIPPGGLTAVISKYEHILSVSPVCEFLPDTKVAVAANGAINAYRYLYSDAVCMAVETAHARGGIEEVKRIISLIHVPSDVLPKLALTTLVEREPQLLEVLNARGSRARGDVSPTSSGFTAGDRRLTDFVLKPLRWRIMPQGKQLECEISLEKSQGRLALPVTALRNARAFVRAVDNALVDGMSPRVLIPKEVDKILAWLLDATKGLAAVNVVEWPGLTPEGYQLPGTCVQAGADTDAGLAVDDRFSAMKDDLSTVEGVSLHLLLVVGAMAARTAVGKPSPGLRLLPTPDNEAALGRAMSWLGQVTPLTPPKSTRPFVHVAPLESEATPASLCMSQDGILLTDSKEQVTINTKNFIVGCVRRALAGRTSFLAQTPSLAALTAEGAAVMDAMYPDKLPVRLDMIDMPACCRMLKLVGDTTEQFFRFSLKEQAVLFNPGAVELAPAPILKELKRRDAKTYTDGENIYVQDTTLRAMLLTYYRKVMPVGHV